MFEGTNVGEANHVSGTVHRGGDVDVVEPTSQMSDEAPSAHSWLHFLLVGIMPTLFSIMSRHAQGTACDKPEKSLNK